MKSKDDEAMRDIIDALKDIRKHQPNGELKRIEKCVKGLAVKVDDIHNKIMDPESGLIVQTNKNTEFREKCEPEREGLINQFNGVLRWKRVIEWCLGVVFVAIIGAVIKIIAT